ncbi:hypothetical protein [Mesorhizobium sp. M0998]|uniref:hypothetical protein n=1 Tax=Mesorhizobium sp. M0998 TaxID=2957044 RepID=UPI0033372C89
MIPVVRDQAVVACAALNKIGSNGLTELEHALWFFGGIAPQKNPLPPKPTKPPAFSVYKEEPVRDALRALFGTRCAYCESNYPHLAQMEVEHYRPKGGYIDEHGVLKKPGYYWLAASWGNLLPSCIDCNRERKQHHRSRDGKIVKSKSGKANRFPILPGTSYATTPAAVALERPMLLNPCEDQPHLHLQFFADGFLQPALTAEERAAGRGRSTIDVCGLARDALVGVRREWALRTKGAMEAVLRADRNRRVYPHDPVMAAQLTDAETNLHTFVDGEAPYHAMTAAMMAAFVEVRSLLEPYFTALEAWKANQSVGNRQALLERATAIQQLRRDARFDEQLVNFLLDKAGVSEATPGKT